MAVTLQVLYPVSAGTKFDHGYYASTHMELVGQHMGPHIQNTVVTKGLSGGPDTPAPFHAVATILFADQDALQAAMNAAGPVLQDIPNFTNVQPQMLIGETVG
ncbi:MAG: EthD family reductase [Leisingera sp.]